MKFLTLNMMFVVINLFVASDSSKEKYFTNVEQFNYCLDNISNYTNLERTKEDIIFYRNGNIKHKTIYYYDHLNNGPYKVIEARYRKNGKRRNVFILDYGVNILYKAKYNKDGLFILEKIYTYNFKNTLVKVETIKDGISTYQIFQTDIFGDPVYD